MTAQKQERFNTSSLWLTASYAHHSRIGYVRSSFISDLLIPCATRNIATGNELQHNNTGCVLGSVQYKQELQRLGLNACKCTLCETSCQTLRNALNRCACYVSDALALVSELAPTGLRSRFDNLVVCLLLMLEPNDTLFRLLAVGSTEYSVIDMPFVKPVPLINYISVMMSSCMACNVGSEQHWMGLSCIMNAVD